MSNVKGALARARDPARTLTLPDGLKWLERSQVEKQKKKKNIPRREGRDEHGGVLTVPLTPRK